MQSETEEIYERDNEFGNIPIIDLTCDGFENISTQIKNEIIDFDQNEEKNKDASNIDEIHLLTECLRVNEIRHTIFLMEYPPTSPEGIAICFNVENWDSYESAFENIQYMTGRPMGSDVLGNFQ
jgi:hypothetical protein